jgi:hypothetical protein
MKKNILVLNEKKSLNNFNITCLGLATQMTKGIGRLQMEIGTLRPWGGA